MNSIALHLGIHKTASTYLQKNLESAENQKVLEKESISMIGPDVLRSNGFTGLVGQIAQSNTPRPGKFGKLREISDTLIDGSGSGRIIFSDENLIGYCTELLNNGKIYPYFEKRMNILNKLFADREVELFICLRSFATYLPSAYCEALRGSRKAFSYTNYTRNLGMDDVTWISFIEIILESFPNSKITLWQFEKLRENGYYEKIINRILSKPLFSELTPPEQDARRSIPAHGIKLINLSKKILTPAETGKLIGLLDEPRMRWERKETFAPLKPFEIDFLNQKYQLDLDFTKSYPDRINII